MTEFEKVLQESLLSLERGDSNVDECLSRHPQHASQLKPILLTSVDLEHGRAARPSAAFKARVRARLTQEMRAHPRKAAHFRFMLMRMATSFAVVLLALLIVGTAYAQSALPGSAFYAWKLASENAWRVVSPDPVGTDLAIAERRADELLAISNDPVLRTQILEAYLEVVARLESEMDANNEARIRQILDAQVEELNQSGIFLPQLDRDILPELPELDEPTVTPTQIQVNPTFPIPTTSPVLIPETAPVNPTDLPEIVPTVQAPIIQVPSLIP